MPDLSRFPLTAAFSSQLQFGICQGNGWLALGKVGKPAAKAWRHSAPEAVANLNRTLVQNRKERAVKTKTAVHAGLPPAIIPEG